MPKVTVVQPVGKPEIATEVIADAIIAISQGIKKLREGRLTDSGLYLLIQRSSPNVGGRHSSAQVSITDIKAVLHGIEDLESTFIKKPKK